jgi:hypothetical protein
MGDRSDLTLIKEEKQQRESTETCFLAWLKTDYLNVGWILSGLA